jgi:hypothetical protein
VSIKIDLEFETKLDLELLAAGISTRLIRLVASLRLKTSRGWTNPYKAIIDTGSPITLIPKHIWEKLRRGWVLVVYLGNWPKLSCFLWIKK